MLTSTALVILVASLQADELPQTAAQLEQRAAFQEIRLQAARCAGAVDCFLAHVRPYGPWIVAVGGRQGAADPALAASVTNFAFGVVGGMAGVNPMELRKRFFCGETCMRARFANLRGRASAAAKIARQLQQSGLALVALWPRREVRANDCVIGAEGVRCYDRSPELGLFRGWTRGRADVSSGLDLTQARNIAEQLQEAGFVAAVEDDHGGVRLVHAESQAENEVGLLAAGLAPPINQQHRDGSRYTIIEPIGGGLFIYLRV